MNSRAPHDFEMVTPATGGVAFRRLLPVGALPPTIATAFPASPGRRVVTQGVQISGRTGSLHALLRWHPLGYHAFGSSSVVPDRRPSAAVALKRRRVRSLYRAANIVRNGAVMYGGNNKARVSLKHWSAWAICDFCNKQVQRTDLVPDASIRERKSAKLVFWSANSLR